MTNTPDLNRHFTKPDASSTLDNQIIYYVKNLGVNPEHFNLPDFRAFLRANSLTTTVQDTKTMKDIEVLRPRGKYMPDLMRPYINIPGTLLERTHAICDHHKIPHDDVDMPSLATKLRYEQVLVGQGPDATVPNVTDAALEVHVQQLSGKKLQAPSFAIVDTPQNTF